MTTMSNEDPADPSVHEERDSWTLTRIEREHDARMGWSQE